MRSAAFGACFLLTAYYYPSFSCFFCTLSFATLFPSITKQEQFFDRIIYGRIMGREALKKMILLSMILSTLSLVAALPR